ncbi:hypothetical protein BD780_003494 [Clostridium tetanomorphum]|uniref:hypothetical protein n=1 Tax=Clostridium tetanomorphum TaxID=1553 RepID=UPI00044DAF49|nr:hypothetical protein [Clostridium tetanomorphum]KAJ49379.1 hypothetical protein CTM_23464 [Clostridium tetanomorphum DSM 665]KAJ51218.1 hypothetical protein CTM_13898 [Clostridium tetanomorphum DSM 665]MBP1863693.1 hypothetical protein [Clostridium tetanomorphum]NRS86269.1 hypothetical protein [Clostridium tetanomorphum]SQC00723.1 Uncharacterised protein [Clostridium tetanomorphum]
MKKVINKKVYNTETAELIAKCGNGLGSSDFRYLFEELYRTKKGQYFLYGEGGPMTKYSESAGNSSWGISTIIPLTDEEAYEWLEENGKSESIEKYFKDLIEEV